MMLREQLQGASFRGIPFLMPSETAKRGKKFVVHEYPNSNKRFFEGLGKLPPIITTDAIIHGTNALQKRLQFEEALELPGLGELIHPVYGAIQVQAGDVSVTSNQREIGRFTFSVTFYTTELNVTAAPSSPTKQTVSTIATEARSAADDALEAQYIPPSTGFNLISAAEKLSSIFGSISSEVKKGTNLIQPKLAEFTREVTAQKNKLYSIAQNGTNVKTSLVGVYTSALFVAGPPDLLIETWESLVDFNISPNGLTSDIGPVNTVLRKEKENNLAALDDHTRLTGLINSFESAAYFDYKTESDIDQARNFLDERYSKYVDFAIAETNDAGLTSLVLDQSLRQSLADLRDTTRRALDEYAQNVWKIVGLNPGITSMSLVAYQYYGSFDQLGIIDDLNPRINHANFSDEIQVVGK